MSDFADRLKKVMEHYGLDASELAERLNIQKSAVSHLLTGRNKPRFDILARFATAFPDLNMRWLLTGEDDLLAPTPQEPGSPTPDLFSSLQEQDTQSGTVSIQETGQEQTDNLTEEEQDTAGNDDDSTTENTVAEQIPDTNNEQQEIPEETPIVQTPQNVPEKPGENEYTEIVRIYPDGTFDVLRLRKPGND